MLAWHELLAYQARVLAQQVVHAEPVFARDLPARVARLYGVRACGAHTLDFGGVVVQRGVDEAEDKEKDDDDDEEEGEERAVGAVAAQAREVGKPATLSRVTIS